MNNIIITTVLLTASIIGAVTLESTRYYKAGNKSECDSYDTINYQGLIETCGMWRDGKCIKGTGGIDNKCHEEDNTKAKNRKILVPILIGVSILLGLLLIWQSVKIMR